MELELVVHVWINHDNDLIDLTLTTATHAPHSTAVKKTSEVIHTTQKHPFFTLEQGFVPVGHLHLGMHILRADGNIGVVTGWKIVPGVKTMYNLEVAQDHTFTVGSGEWVVHNCGNIEETLQKLKDAGVQWGKDNHFAQQLMERAKTLNAEDIKDILVNGDPIYDTKNFNYGMMRRIGATKYAIFFDGDGTLMTFLTEDEISGVKGRYIPTLRSLMPTNFGWLDDVDF